MSSSNKEANANIRDLINKFNGNSNPSKPSHQHTTECRRSEKCDIDIENRSGATECREIQRECLTNDSTDAPPAAATSAAETFIQESETTTLDLKSAEEHEAKARELREKAQATLEKNEMEFVQAERAQAAARIASEQANAKTAEALKHQEIGQELLAEAGAKLIEAGAKLQKEAMANQKQVSYNIHQQGEVRQTTCVSAAGMEAAAAAHDIQTFREVEHLPATAH